MYRFYFLYYIKVVSYICITDIPGVSIIWWRQIMDTNVMQWDVIRHYHIIISLPEDCTEGEAWNYSRKKVSSSVFPP